MTFRAILQAMAIHPSPCRAPYTRFIVLQCGMTMAHESNASLPSTPGMSYGREAAFWPRSPFITVTRPARRNLFCVSARNTFRV
jgi:hypothetical protein